MGTVVDVAVVDGEREHDEDEIDRERSRYA
jgi:hypothetical protein